jgi:hypothetical protein
MLRIHRCPFVRRALTAFYSSVVLTVLSSSSTHFVCLHGFSYMPQICFGRIPYNADPLCAGNMAHGFYCRLDRLEGGNAGDI